MIDSPLCRLCGAKTVSTLNDRTDHEYGVTVRLDYWSCTDCGLVFADPVPSALIPSFYAAYSTHERIDPDQRNGVWNLIDQITPALDRAGSFASLDIPKSARILDFGCGAGVFLDELHRAGFANLAGCDFDPKVAATALPGLQFFTGIDHLADETFDAIAMNHVLEHVEDVPSTLARLRAHLRPGGFIYIRTPNARSMLAGMFRDNWRGWETPRHLNVLTPKAMQLAVGQAGGELAMLVTSNDMRAGMLMGSLNIALGGLPGRLKTLAGVIACVPGAWLIKARHVTGPMSGEEIVAIVH